MDSKFTTLIELDGWFLSLPDNIRKAIEVELI